jgi:2-succinyl-5-enolpyruvyl-6-hydroxy-3-cyclohexene-1-carboxylate synthase
VGDPFCSITKIIAVEPQLFFAGVVKLNINFAGIKPDVGGGVSECTKFCSFGAVQKILASLPERSVLHLGNSMPVRIADCIGVIGRELEVRSNRGTSGIDGVVSTAVGHALADRDRLHTLIVGDLSFFYDRNALWLNCALPDNLRIVIINNGGGGIFEMIEGPSRDNELLPLFTAPHARTAELTAKEFGLSYRAVSSHAELDAALENFVPGIVEIFTDRKRDAEVLKSALNR